MNNRNLDLRLEVATFAVRMEQVLRDHDHKGGWQALTLEQLFNRAVDELDELLRAIKWDQPPETIAREATDVANFMMMIADRALAQQRAQPLTHHTNPEATP